MGNATRNLTIGALAKAAGVGVETVRFYQRKGLVREPPRPYGQIRRYAAADAARIRFIKAAQELGFSLAEVGDLLSLEDGGACRDVQRLAQHKLADVRRRLARLRRIERSLAALIGRCETTRGRVACPIIASLEAAGDG